MASPAPDAFAYLDTPDAVAAFAADALENVHEIAVDTEGASFHRFIDRVYLLQLSTRDRSAVVDPLPEGIGAALAPLGRLLEDRHVEVVFHDADYDLRLLHQDYGWRITRIFDTRIAAQLLGHKAFGLAALLERYFGVVLDKKHQRADWSMRPLTASMLDYAAQDTRWLLPLRDRMKAELVERGRWAWAEEEFARLEGTQWAPEDAENAFLRVKGARDLTRRELALLRELVPWRDATARQLDRSTFRVVGNEVLLEIARQAPATRQALGAIKGMPRGILENRGDDILAAVQRGLAVSEGELPRFPRAPRWDRDPDFDEKVSRVKAVRDAAAARLELDPGVLCSRERLEAIVRRAPASVDDLLDMKELRRWQAAELGERIVEALAAFAAAHPAPPPAPGTPVPAAVVEAAREEPARRGRQGRGGSGASRAGGGEESPYRDE